MPAAKTIFIFGDSITYGEWDALGGWANRLRTYHDSSRLPLPQDQVLTYNLGIPSDTSSGVRQRLTQETEARLNPNPNPEAEIQFIIAIGTNDSRFLQEENKHGVGEQEFKANLEAITLAARSFTQDITFIGLLPCVETKVIATAKRREWDSLYDNQSIKIYNEIIKQHCQSAGLEFIDLNAFFEDKDIDSLFDDGLHPNTEGHALMFDYISKRLES